ncbi:MAG TPA: hypothetical protein VGJ70_01795 [Solirubrobacteraceae bacterium]|jgi:hypothetical protein
MPHTHAAQEDRFKATRNRVGAERVAGGRPLTVEEYRALREMH